MTEIVKKITVKGVVGDRIAKPEKAVALCHIYGVCNGFKAGQTQYGNFVKFSGRFEGMNLETGEVQASGALILPGIAENLLAGVVGENESVEFAFEIGIKPSKSPVGYDFTVKSLIEHRGSDPLASLRDQVANALPAPAKK